MRLALNLHPDFRCTAATRIEAALSRTARGLAIRYEVEGDVGRLRLPRPAAPVRADALWRTTCFEFFVQDDGAGYREFNFSPSTQWAGYAFSGYRAGMASLDTCAPRIERRTGPARYSMRVDLDGDFRAGAACALTAVLEEADGAKSYWSLRHPPGRPDFHHRDNFAALLPASET